MRIHTCVCKDFSYVINDFILYYWLFAFQIHYNCGKYLLVGIYQHFVGRADAEAEAPIHWPPDAKSQLVGNDPDAGKD